MTLEEAAFAIWMIEGRKTPKPFSKIYARKLEQSALRKMRKGLAKYKICKVDDVLDLSSSRQRVAYGTADDNID